MLDKYEKLGAQPEAEDIILLQEAHEKYRSGLLDEAERIFGFLSLNYPDDLVVLNDYGACLFRNGKIKDAIRQFTRALDLNPDYKEAAANLIESCKAFFSEEERGGIILHHLDAPDLSTSYIISGIECFEGWTISRLGIETIEVYVNDKFICSADYGLPRPDVQANHPDIEGSYNSGYRFYLNTLKLPNGIYKVSIKILTGDEKKEVRNDIFVKVDNIPLSCSDVKVLERYEELERDEPVLDRSILLPSYISLETTTSCPARCIMCPREAVLKRRKNRVLSEKLVDKIFDEVDWECKINWEWINDPLCDERIYGFMKRAKKLSFENWITTTGFLLDRDKSHKLLDGSVDCVVFSIDTLNRDLFKKIRGLDLDVILKNIRDFMDIKEQGRSKTKVWITKIQLPLTKSDSREQFTGFFKEMGIEKIQFPAYRLRGGWMDGEIARQDVPNRYKCYFIENELAITTDGDVILCPCEAGAWIEPEANISKMSVREAWLTPKRIETIRLIRTGGLKAYKSCREHAGLPE